jgi:hypothetical protein
MTIETKLLEIPEDGETLEAVALVKGKTAVNASTNFYNGKISFYSDEILNQLSPDAEVVIGDTTVYLQLINAHINEFGNAVQGNGYLDSQYIQFVCYQLNNEGNNISEFEFLPGKTNANTNFHSNGGYPINGTDGMTSFGMKFTITNSFAVSAGKLYIKFDCTRRQNAQSGSLEKWGILEFTDVNGLMTVTFNWV